ncbi:MAG: hypothetical protein HZC17_03160, partial [Candidatus Omnitrophica bacterium]|nr:hypothetical protein [Candidatus Omnitrophota bacterium]
QAKGDPIKIGNEAYRVYEQLRSLLNIFTESADTSWSYVGREYLDRLNQAFESYRPKPPENLVQGYANAEEAGKALEALSRLRKEFPAIQRSNHFDPVFFRHREERDKDDREIIFGKGLDAYETFFNLINFFFRCLNNQDQDYLNFRKPQELVGEVRFMLAHRGHIFQDEKIEIDPRVSEIGNYSNGGERALPISQNSGLPYVLYEICKNASQAGSSAALRICPSQDSKSIEIQIQDNGTHGGEAALRNMFHVALTTKGSSGIGLFISKGIVRFLGGSLEVVSRNAKEGIPYKLNFDESGRIHIAPCNESNISEGTLFRITLPIIHKAEESVQGASLGGKDLVDHSLKSGLFSDGEVEVDVADLGKGNFPADRKNFKAENTAIFGNIKNNAVFNFNRFFRFSGLKLYVERIRFLVKFYFHVLLSFLKPVGRNDNDAVRFFFVGNFQNTITKLLLSQMPSFVRGFVELRKHGGLNDLICKNSALSHARSDVSGVVKVRGNDYYHRLLIFVNNIINNIKQPISAKALESKGYVVVNAASLGAGKKLNIPGAVWVAVKLLDNFAGRDQIKRDIEAGFLIPTREKDVYLAPVIRDPSIVHPKTIHKRTMFSIPTAEEASGGMATRVIKGAGLEQPRRGILFEYDRKLYFNTQRFRGGDQYEFSRHAANVATKIHREYQKALAEKDGAVMVAKREFGIQEAPVLKPLYLFRPLEIPAKKRNRVIHDNAKAALKQAGVPERVIRNQAIFVYEVPLNTRMDEMGYIEDLMKDYDPDLAEKILNVYGNPEPPEYREEILKRFAARLSLANHLMHRRLRGSFSAVVTGIPDLPFASSLNEYNVTIAGVVTDLDTATFNIKPDQAADCLMNDHAEALQRILELAGYLDISATEGHKAYWRIWRKNTRPKDLLTWLEIIDRLPLATSINVVEGHPINLGLLLAAIQMKRNKNAKARQTIAAGKSLGQRPSGKSLGSMSAPADDLNELTLEFRSGFHGALRRALFWEGSGVILFILRFFFAKQIASRRDKFPDEELMKPRKWIHYARTKLNWVENDLADQKSVPFDKINRLHHQIVGLMRQYSEDDEPAFFPVYESGMHEIFWETILRRYDNRIDEEGESIPILMPYIHKYIELVRRVIPGMGEPRKDENKDGEASAASLGQAETFGLKAARLEEAIQLGYPVPAFFVLTTDQVKEILEAYSRDGKFPEKIRVFVREQLDTLKRRAVGNNPLFVSVRSSEVDYRPGFMKSLLNVPADEASFDQLLNSILEVAESAAKHHVFTAVMIQEMVFGNQNTKSGTGILLTENPNTGRPEPVIQFLSNSQGPELTRGESNKETQDGAWLAEAMPQVHADLIQIGERAARDFKGPQEIEFTVDNGKLYILQILSEALPPQISLPEITHRALHGKITWASAAFELSESLSHKKLYALKPDVSVHELARGLAVSPGAGRGFLIISLKAAQEFRKNHPTAEFIIADDAQHLTDALPELVKLKPSGIVTPDGASANHLASIARLLGIPYVARLWLEPNLFRLGSVVIIDGDSGRVLSDVGSEALEEKSVLSLAHLNIDLEKAREEVERQKKNFAENAPYNRLIAAHDSLRQQCLPLEKKIEGAKTLEEKSELASRIITQHLITHWFHEWVIARGNEYRQKGVRAAFRTLPQVSQSRQDLPGWHNQRKYSSQHSFDLEEGNRGILLLEGVKSESWDPAEAFMRENVSRVGDLMDYLDQKKLPVSSFTIYESEASGDSLCTGMGVQFSPELENEVFNAIIEFYTSRPDVKGASLGKQLTLWNLEISKRLVPDEVKILRLTKHEMNAWLAIVSIWIRIISKRTEFLIKSNQQSDEFKKAADDIVKKFSKLGDYEIKQSNYKETISKYLGDVESDLLDSDRFIKLAAVALNDTDLDENAKKLAQRARDGYESSKIFSAIVKEILESEQNPARLTNVNHVIELAKKLYGNKIQGVAVETVFKKSDIQTPVSGLAILTILGNLISNAKDHGDAKEIKIELDSNIRAGMIKLKVSNDGKEISPEDARKIFQEGFSTRPKSEGRESGMGLYWTRQFLTSQDVGGDIQVTRKAGKTVFTIDLPLARPARSARSGRQKNKNLFSSSDGASLGLRKIEIPGTVWVPVKIIENYAGKDQIERDIAAGFLVRKPDGSLWAPVIRDPSIVHPETIHGRSVHGESRVVKGAGIIEAVRGIPFDFDKNQRFSTQKFRGGETSEFASPAAEAAQAIHKAYEKAFRTNDPAVISAREKYGIQEAPGLKPFYLLRPLKIPVKEKDGIKLFDPKEALSRVNVPDGLIRQQIIFVYEVPNNVRLIEWVDLNPDKRQRLMESIYGKSFDAQKVLKQFSARLALANYLVHQYLNGTFAAEVDTQDSDEDQSPFVSSMYAWNITLSGDVVDLDSVSLDWKDQIPRLLQDKDDLLAKEAIRDFAGRLKISAQDALSVYEEIYNMKSKPLSASSLGERASHEAQLEVARAYANRIVFMPGVSDEFLRSALKGLGLFNDMPRRAINSRTATFNRDLGPAMRYLDLHGSVPVPIILDDMIRGNAKEIASKLEHAMRDQDFLGIDWNGQKPAFVSELRRLANHRFEVRDVQRSVLTDAIVSRWLKRFNVAPIWIGAVGGTDSMQVSFTNGDRVMLNLKVLEREGVDPTQVVALLRQIAGQPSKRHELFNLAGFIKSGDAWEVGEGFVTILLNKIYADRSTQQSLQHAA